MERLSRRTFTAAAAGTLAAVTLPANAQAADTPAAGAGTEHAPVAGGHGAGHRQLRGMWIATVANTDWPSAPGLSPEEQRQELCDLLDVAVERRLNAVMFQVRPTADALWPSPYEPWARYLTGVQGRDPGWDPLGTAVHEAHRRGLELHAWFNPYRVSLTTDVTALAPTHPARLHPEWIVSFGGKLYYNPGLPEVRRFVEDAMLDAVRRYPIDAVHWDDYFYPYPVAGQTFQDDDAYARYGTGFPDRDAWRRNNTDLLVRRWPSASSGSGHGRGSASARSACGATRAPTRWARQPLPACRPTTICTPTPASGFRRSGSTTSFRRCTGT